MKSLKITAVAILAIFSIALLTGVNSVNELDSVEVKIENNEIKKSKEKATVFTERKKGSVPPQG